MLPTLLPLPFRPLFSLLSRTKCVAMDHCCAQLSTHRNVFVTDDSHVRPIGKISPRSEFSPCEYKISVDMSNTASANNAACTTLRIWTGCTHNLWPVQADICPTWRYTAGWPNTLCFTVVPVFQWCRSKFTIFLHLISTIKRTIFRKVRRETILKIYNILVLPTFLYGSQNWTLTALQRRRIEAAGMKLLKPLASNWIPLKSYHYRPQGRRTIGRPKKRWREQL